MSYYIGFRFGWVRVFGHTIGWSDPKMHPMMAGRLCGAWKVWVK
jgi:hypothetical protein